MPDQKDSLAIAIFGEMFMAEQLARGQLSRALPNGMTLAQFSVLNHLSRSNGERTPAQLARSFHLTKGAMTNTISRLEAAGHIHIRPDWDDARRKFVSISASGTAARDAALSAMAPILNTVVANMGEERLKAALPILRDIRVQLDQPVSAGDAP